MESLQLTYVVGADGTRTLTLPDEKRAMVIAFVRDNAKKSPAEIEAVVQEGHDELFAALDEVSEAQAAWKPSENDWSVLELMAHVVTVKQITFGLSSSLSQGQLPPGAGPEWEEPSRQDGVTIATPATLADARAGAEAAHQLLLGYIRKLDDGAINTETVFRHFLFGAFNAREWPVFQRIHDGDHGPTIGKIRSMAGFPAA